MTISDNSGATVTIDGTGTVTYSANCRCVTNSVVVAPGSITWSGKFNAESVQISNLQGRSKPALTSPAMDLSVQKIVAGANGATITVTWSDIGFTGFPPVTMTQMTSDQNSLTAPENATYTAYVDDTNTLFGQGTLVGVIGPVTVPPTSTSSLTGAGPTAQTFSMTEVEQLTVGPTTSNNSVVSYIANDFSVSAAPIPPLTLSCAVASGQMGYTYNSALTTNGGVPPYNYSITAGALPPGLTLDPSSGTITGDPLAAGPFNFTASVVDSSGRTGSNTVTAACGIVVIPPPAPPSLSCSAGTGLGNSPYNSSLVANGGTPPYTFSIISGSLPAGLFLNSATGAITGTANGSGVSNFTAQVVDSSGNSDSSTITAPCAINVYPPVTSNCVSINAIAGVPITPVQMKGSGGAGGPYTFSATGLPSGLTMASDGTISGTPAVSGTFNYSVTVTDSAGNQGTVNCSVTVYSPVTSNCVSINAIAGVPITPVQMTGSGGAGGPYTFSATGLPSGLTMASDGTISGTPQVTGTFSYSVTVTDSAGNHGTVNCSVTVYPSVTSNCVSINAVAGVPITPVQMAGSGGAGGPYTFSATGLPSGLTMASNGTISGTPQVTGTFSYSVTVTDSAGNHGTVNCSVTVYPSVTSNCVSINAVAGVPITPMQMAGSGGAGGPYTFSATGLPSGLTMASNGTISGTPQVTGTFSYSVTVTDSAGNHGTVNCSVTVYPSVTSNCVSIDAIAGVSITPVQMAGSGGVGGPYTFSATGLPSGLTMASNGTISGTPTVTGTFNYSVTVTDSAGNHGTVNCSVTVNPLTGAGLVKGDTATIGFWHNKNGQALIDSLNGGASSTALANWLATQFPYLYGPQSQNNLTNKTNSDVAALFMTFFNVSGQKTNAQILCSALAVYVTNSNLAGTVAAGYGFNVSTTGTGQKTYNVSGNGTAIGLNNNSPYTVMELLLQANADVANGSFNANAFNTIFDSINTGGDI